MFEKNLDDSSWIRSIDKSAMLERISELPDHLKEAFDIAIASIKQIPDINSVVFFGLGGSAIAGELITEKLLGHSSIPAMVIRKSKLPVFVGKNTLCIALSYSGNTKETLDCYKEAIQRGASVIAVTSGGKLKKLSVENNNTLVIIPSNYQPRAALGLLIGAALGALSKLNLIKNLDEVIENTAKLLSNLKEKYNPQVPAKDNLAKKIALELHGKLPLIYASESLGVPTANRWKSQLNENAKVMSFSNSFPELAHNEIMSTSKVINPVIVYLKNPNEKADQLIANNIALKLMRSNSNNVLEVASEGETHLEKMLSVAYLGDYVSAYLAILESVDPTPVERISILKQELKQTALNNKPLDTIES